MKNQTYLFIILSILLVTVVTLTGCRHIYPRNPLPKPTPITPYPLNKTLVGYATPGFSSRNDLTVSGYGLVYNLGDNGGVEIDSVQRKLVSDELNRFDVPNPSKVIDSKDTAIVLVQAKIPPGTRKGDPIDVSITLPATSECRSLQGGILFKTILTEMYDTGAKYRRGKTWAMAEGPLLLDTKSEKNNQNAEKRAVLLGKTECQFDRDFSFSLNDEGRGSRQLTVIATELENRINKRFKIEGEMTGVAKVRSQPSVCVDVKMHPHYSEAPGRYLAVIMSIRCFETDAQREQRMELLKQALFDPEKSEMAALQLEALPGKLGADILYEGMKSPNRDVQFYSTESLAFMHKPGVGEVLAEFARNDPKKRSAAIVALASMGSDLEAEKNLIPLMVSGDSDLRYGAFWALWTRSPEHPAIRAWSQEEYPYHYHDLSFDVPLVHAIKSRRPEIVLFSPNITLRGPFVGNAGNSILVKVLSPEQIEITRVNPGRINDTRTRPNSLDRVLEAIAELGGSYQDTLQFLSEVGREQPNGSTALSCQVVIEDDFKDKERSYNNAIYAEDEEERSVLEASKKESTIGKLNPVTWFAKDTSAQSEVRTR